MRLAILFGCSASLLATSAAAETTELDVKGSVESPWAGRPGTSVTKRELEERLPRSAPDALRFEPGVFVQQTGHGQGSPIVRGRTGQQTVLLFDGIRLNNSIYRQGPNQYFFTIDARTIHSIDVLRGGASTLYGSDAIGGVLHARPIEPTWAGELGTFVRPRAFLRWASADADFAERGQVDAQIGSVLVLAGVGFRRAGLLRSGGPVRSPLDGTIPQVPAFDSDGKTQLGTGFKELTSDLRVVYPLAEDLRLVGAAYLYRQYDAPRADQCPPPFASRTECLEVEEQFRTLTYLALEGRFAGLEAGRIAVSYQRQHERRRRRRPRSFVDDLGRDDVDTLGLMTTGRTARTPLGAGLVAKLDFGADAYFDLLHSTAYQTFTDLDFTKAFSRGQYLDGSRYGQGGLYIAPELAKPRSEGPDSLVVRGGGRLGFARATSPSDPESASLAIDRGWATWSSFGQLEWSVVPALSFIGTVDRSFRAPNLDDLTSRQQAGPGFQFENPTLRSETSLTLEAGARLTLPWLRAEAWVYRARVDDAITRATRAAADCPPSTPQCAASANRYQLVNTPGASTIDGFELSLRLRLPRRFVVRATFAYAYGEGPNPQARPTDPSVAYEDRVPLSRVAPMNGTAELRWSDPTGLYLGGALRWATTQTRLAISDRSDARIPLGGTPGFAVVDLRAGFRVDRRILVSVVLENVLDNAYRTHGSSINGPGRGVIVGIESGL